MKNIRRNSVVLVIRYSIFCSKVVCIVNNPNLFFYIQNRIEHLSTKVSHIHIANNGKDTVYEKSYFRLFRNLIFNLRVFINASIGINYILSKYSYIYLITMNLFFLISNILDKSFIRSKQVAINLYEKGYPTIKKG